MKPAQVLIPQSNTPPRLIQMYGGVNGTTVGPLPPPPHIHRQSAAAVAVVVAVAAGRGGGGDELCRLQLMDLLPRINQSSGRQRRRRKRRDGDNEEETEEELADVFVSSVALGPLRTNHTFAVAAYMGQLRVSKTQAKSWLIVLHTTTIVIVWRTWIRFVH